MASRVIPRQEHGVGRHRVAGREIPVQRLDERNAAWQPGHDVVRVQDFDAGRDVTAYVTLAAEQHGGRHIDHRGAGHVSTLWREQ